MSILSHVDHVDPSLILVMSTLSHVDHVDSSLMLIMSTLSHVDYSLMLIVSTFSHVDPSFTPFLGLSLPSLRLVSPDVFSSSLKVYSALGS